MRHGLLSDLSACIVTIAVSYLDHGYCLAGCSGPTVSFPAPGRLYIQRVPRSLGAGSGRDLLSPGDIEQTRRPRFHGNTQGLRQSAESGAAMNRVGLAIQVSTVPRQPGPSPNAAGRGGGTFWRLAAMPCRNTLFVG